MFAADRSNCSGLVSAFLTIGRRLRAVLGSLDPRQWLATTLRSMRRIMARWNERSRPLRAAPAALSAPPPPKPSLVLLQQAEALCGYTEPAVMPRSRSATRA